MDVIASHQRKLLRKSEHFQVWKLNTRDRIGNVYCEDGNGRRIKHQRIDYTDFPLSTIKLWAVWDGKYLTIMLPSEY